MKLPSYQGISEKDKPRYFQYVEEVLNGKLREEGLEFQYRKRDGKEVWLSIQINPVKNEKGEITYLQSNTRNIDVQKKYELQLKESEANASAILNSSDSLIILMDREQKIVKANDKVRILAPRLFGKSIEDSMSVEKLIPSNHTSTYLVNVKKALDVRLATPIMN